MDQTGKSGLPSRNKRIVTIVFVSVVLLVIACAIWFVVLGKPLPAFFQDYDLSLHVDTPTEPVIVCTDVQSNPGAEEALREWLEENEDTFESGYEITSFRDSPSPECSVILSSKDHDGYDLAWRKYYILTAHDRSPFQNITRNQLDELLAGNEISLDLELVSLVMDEEAYDAMDRAIGVGVGVQTEEQISEVLEGNDNVVGIIPFEDMSLGLKEVLIEGSSLLQKKETSAFPLVEEVWISEGTVEGLFEEVKKSLGEVNYSPDKVATVVMTGTSVVGARKIYIKSLEQNDWLYAWRDVAETLREADIAHISNEASFSPDCEQYSWTMVFCGPDDAFEGLTWAGIDVVGLTGNHILDAGRDAFLDTLSMFEDAEIEYFGGGATYEDAHTAAVIEVGGMKFAFLGYNMIPPASYFAEGEEPGSAELIESDMVRDIEAIRDEVDFIFVDMQWGPEYERYPNSYQVEFGHKAVDAGADIVNGVHPHWIQPVEEYRGGLIFYSLGNFLFDQLWSIDTREGLMVQHYFYDGAYLGYEPIPVFLSNEMQTRIAAGADRSRILGYLYLEL